MKPKQILGYGFFFVIMFVFFSFAYFPQKQTAVKISAIIEQQPNITKVDIQRASLEFPLNIRLKDIEVTLKNKTILKPDNVLIQPGFFSLWRHNKNIQFTVNIFNGSIKGQINYSAGKQDPIEIVDLNIAGLNIENLKYDIPLAQMNINCTLNAVYGDDKKSREPGQTKIDLQGMSIKLGNSLFNEIGIPELNFSEIEIVSLQNKQQLKITRFIARGSEINLAIDGEINLLPQFENSELSLTGTIMPDSKKLSRFTSIKSFGNKPQNIQSKGLQFKISGTLSEPKINL